MQWDLLLPVAFVSLLGAVAGFWAWINFSGRYGGVSRHALRVAEGKGEDESEAGGAERGGSGSYLEAQIPKVRFDHSGSISEPSLQTAETPLPPRPRVAVLVPGRNEADHLPRTLSAMCRQRGVDHTVIFIDDDSTDDTPRIVAEIVAGHANLLALRIEGGPPPGWVGKCHAIARGYEALQEVERSRGYQSVGPGDVLTAPTSTPWLLFTDADVDWHPDLLRSALALADANDADVVGLLPLLRFGSIGEAVVQIQLALALALFFPIERAMDPAHPDTLIGGAFILTRRDLYDRAGGHAAPDIRGQVVEDLALGKALKAHGGRVRIAPAGDLLTCRMYDGWRDQWEGLTKNAYAGLGHSPLKAAAVGVAVLVCNILGPAYLAAAVLWLLLSPGVLPALAVVLALLTVLLPAAALNVVRNMFRLPWYYAFSMPPGSAIYLGILVASVWDYHRGGNVWKGRRYGNADT